MSKQIAAWHNREESPDDFFLIRLYEGGTMTATRKIDGTYLPEVELTAEAFDFLGAPA